MGKIYETLIGKELDTMQLGAVTYEVHPMVTGVTAWRHSARLQGGTARQRGLEFLF